jgi:hypothetical protein
VEAGRLVRDSLTISVQLDSAVLASRVPLDMVLSGVYRRCWAEGAVVMALRMVSLDMRSIV